MDRYIDLRPLERFTRFMRTMSWLYFVWGLLLIAWGVAILIWPELLVALVAALFMMAGISVLLIGWRIWAAKRSYERVRRRVLPWWVR